MITSLQNEQVKHVVSLQRRKGRQESGEFIVEGRRFVEEAIRRQAPIEKVFICPGRLQDNGHVFIQALFEQGIPYEEVEERVFRKMSATEEPQGILAVVRQAKYTWSDLRLDESTVLLVVDGVQDPGNLGTIIRTGLAAGVNQFCFTKGTVDVYNPKVLRSTMGAIFVIRCLHDLSPEEIMYYCKENGVTVCVGDIEGEILYRSNLTERPLALVVGNEGSGPSLLFRTGGTRRITIPMANSVESLNVAMATGILLYEIVRQRDFL